MTRKKMFKKGINIIGGVSTQYKNKILLHNFVSFPPSVKINSVNSTLSEEVLKSRNARLQQLCQCVVGSLLSLAGATREV